MDVHEHALLDDEDEPNVDRREITNRIVAACIAVHREPRPGDREACYERALEIEFRRRSIPYRHQVPFQVMYCGHPIGSGPLDFVIEEMVVLELKHVVAMSDVFTATMISYLQATNLRLGPTVNFNVKYLKAGIKRVML